MKENEIQSLIHYRLKQAETALEDGEFLLEGKRSPQSVINRAYYAMFYVQPWHCYKALVKFPPNMWEW